MYKYVLVAPICATPPHLYGLSVGDKADIPCNVAANPTQVHYHQPHTEWQRHYDAVSDLMHN